MGEEMGLWGSEYFTRFPTVPIEKIVAQLNIDMIGRSRAAGDSNPRNKDLSGPNEVYVIGSKMMSTELGALSEAVNDAFLKLAYNYKYDDPKDPERFFYRSDHIHYARKGIPIIFYFTGVHADYHQPSRRGGEDRFREVREDHEEHLRDVLGDRRPEVAAEGGQGTAGGGEIGERRVNIWRPSTVHP